MSAKGGISVTFAWLAFTVVLCQEDNCHHKKVAVCMENFYQYQNYTSHLFPDVSDHKLRSICSEFDEVTKCLEPMRATCGVYEQYYYMGLEESFAYVCQEHNIQVYLKHKSCLGGTEVRSKGVECLWTFHLSVILQYEEKKICKYSETFMNCIKDEVNEHCGKEASEWQYDVIRLSFAAVNVDYKCNFGKVHLSGGAIAGISISVILVVLAIVGIVVYVYRHRITKKLADARSQHMDHYGRQQNEPGTAVERTASPRGDSVPEAAHDYSLPYNQGQSSERGAIGGGYSGQEGFGVTVSGQLAKTLEEKITPGQGDAADEKKSTSSVDITDSMA